MSSSDRLTVLGVGAHPSDIFPGISGTLAKHAKRGDNVILLSLTYGVEVHTEDLLGKSVQEIKDIVQRDSTRAASIIGANDYRFLDLGDTPLVPTRENLIEVGEVIQDIRPDIIISAHYPFREDQWGGDHGVCARMLEKAPSWRQHFGKEPHRVKAIYYCAIDYLASLNHPVKTLPDTFVDITDTMEQKIQACDATWAIIGSRDPEKWAAGARRMHRYFGACVGVEYAEPFESPSRQIAVDYLKA